MFPFLPGPLLPPGFSPAGLGGPHEGVAPEYLVRGGVSEAWPAAWKHIPGQAFQHKCLALMVSHVG